MQAVGLHLISEYDAMGSYSVKVWALRGEPTVQVSLVQDLWLDDFLNNVLQGDNTQNLVERVSLTLIVHPLNYGQVGFS